MKYLQSLWPLFLVQFFTWLALFSLWIYTTPVVTKYIFNQSGTSSLNYQNGIQWVGFCFAFYSLLSGFLGFMIPKWTKMIGLYKYHSFSLAIGSMGLILMSFLTLPIPFLLSFAFIGIAWSSIGSVPYTILGEIAPESGAEKIYIIFNFSIIIPQVIAAFLLGFLTERYFHGESKFTLLLGGIFMFIGSLIMFLLKPLKKIEE